jgi:hypothetical protein
VLQRGRKSANNLALFPGATLADRIAAPNNLSATERLTFDQVVANAPRNHFTKNDAPLLAAYVQALTLTQHYAKKARTDHTFSKPHNQAAKTVAMLAMKLRLAPQSRVTVRTAGRMAAKAKQMQLSAYELMDDA